MLIMSVATPANAEQAKGPLPATRQTSGVRIVEGSRRGRSFMVAVSQLGMLWKIGAHVLDMPPASKISTVPI